MKSRISFFDGATFKKDITRFLPLWVLYTIAMLLIMLSTVSVSVRQSGARELCRSLEAMPLLNLLFGAVSAQLLFGELFQGRLCNALHAMPMTRTARFGSHVAAGLLFSLVPNLLVTALMLPYLENLWFTAFLWLAVMTLEYLFFFAAGVLSVMCTGSRFAMVLVYAIINFLSIVVYWFVDMIFVPMLPGVVTDDTFFLRCCPVATLFTEANFFEITVYRSAWAVTTEFAGFRSGWIYLFICAALGVAALVLSALLYRRRHLESAGDFIAVKWLSPIFLVLYTLCAGAFLSIFGNAFSGDGYLVFLIAGLVIGFFTGKMLLERTAKVFGKKSFLQCAVLAAVILLSLGAAKLDVLGIVDYVPEPEDVRYIHYDSRNAWGITLTEQEHIETVCQIHTLALTDGCQIENCGNSHNYFRVEYYMKDGRKVVRQYYLCSSTAEALLNTLPKTEIKY